MTFSLMILAALAVPGASGGEAFAVQDSRDVNGQTVTSVRHSGGGRFAEAGLNQWNEYAAGGRVVATFQVYSRDTFSVVLHDRSRNTSVIIDLRARTIVSGTIGRGQRLLYTVTGVEAARRRDDDRGGPVSRWRGVDGNNVNYVRVNDGGTFEESGPRRWNQYEPNGRLWSQLEEVRRDGSTVVLNDRGRRVEVVLDLRTAEVRGTEPGTTRWRRYYSITDAEARRGGRGDGGRGDDRDVRDRDVRDRDDTRPVEVGPIWNQRDAETKCADKARELRGEWTGGWWTTQPGRMSVCEIRTGGRGGRGDDRGGWGGQRDVVRNIEVGPIWNQNDAVAKCNAKGRELRAEWTGQWRTTQTGRMSECEFRFR